MIAHSGFSRFKFSDQVAADIDALNKGLMTKAEHHASTGLPADLAAWLGDPTPVPLLTAAQKEWAKLHPLLPVPAPAAPSKLNGLNPSQMIIDDYDSIPPEVPMALHLEHLKITAKAARNFWLTIGCMIGFLIGSLLTDFLYHRYG